ncbi:MAG: flagellin FliC [Candidatus Riflebacteria bacterium]|nr:flagellin FliC [Candidatus Riflebacteria bacterium]
MNINKMGSLAIVNRLNDVQASQDKSVAKLASGKRINSASDGPTEMALSMNLETLIRSLTGQISNRQNEISMMQTSEGAMSTTSEMLQRINELAIQAANGTLTDDDRNAIQQEISQLREQVNMNASNAEFNGKKLLNGSLDIQLQNGQQFSLNALNSKNLGLDSLDVTTVQGAQNVMALSQAAIEKVTSERARVGSVSNGISSEVQALNDQMVNSMASLSKIADTDMAYEVLNNANAQIQANAAAQVFKSDNAMRGRVLQLLGL